MVVSTAVWERRACDYGSISHHHNWRVLFSNQILQGILWKPQVKWERSWDMLVWAFMMKGAILKLRKKKRKENLILSAWNITSIYEWRQTGNIFLRPNCGRSIIPPGIKVMEMGLTHCVTAPGTETDWYGGNVQLSLTEYPCSWKADMKGSIL